MNLRGLDTNVLVYALIPELELHEKVRRFLLAEIQNPESILVITPNILHELVHVVTDGRRFENPVTVPEALEVARGYLGKSNILCVDVKASILGKAFELMERYKLGRKRIADTIFAAALIEAGAREVISCNADDFAIFEDLTVIDPCR